MTLLAAAPLHAGITIKIAASNPSSFLRQEVPIKSYLPKGIRPEHVIDSGGLEVACDEKRGQCFVYKNLELEPQASALYDVEIDDIWLIDDETLENLEDKTERIAGKLAGTEHAESAGQFRQKIKAGLDAIRARQEASLASKVGPLEHIRAYDDNEAALDLVAMDVENLARLFDAAQGNAPMPALTGIQDDEARKKILELGLSGEGNSCLVEKALEEEEGGIAFDAPETVLFRMKVENPSAAESLTMPLKYFLPKEARAKDVVDSGGLNVGFDFERNMYYVFSDEVRLAPAESRVFTMTLNNKWALDKRDVYSSKIYIESMMRSAAKTGLSAVQALGEQALSKVYDLLRRQDITELTEDSVGVFRGDRQTAAEIGKSVQEMKDLLIAAGISPELSLVEQEHACREARKLGLGQKELDEALIATVTLEAQKGKRPSGAVFKGESVATFSTWKIIGYIVIFLGIISAVFYFLSIREQKGAMFDVLTGALARGYALERFREEVKVAKGTGRKCSLLVMDIDKFKGINDTHGHAVGDMILKEFVIAMRKGVRATDLIGRFGGDEFVIVLPTSEKKVAHKIAEGIARIVEGTAIKVTPQLTLNITTSIGVATFPDDSGTADDLFDKADQALYQVKQRGGNGAAAFGGQS